MSTSCRVFGSNTEQYENLIQMNTRAGLDNYTKSDWLILNLCDTVEPQLSTKATSETVLS